MSAYDAGRNATEAEISALGANFGANRWLM
jgi:hypothetical protein